KTFGRIILGALVASLTLPRGTQEFLTAKEYADTEDQGAVFKQALQCTRSLVDFHMYAQYKEHTNQTLRCMESSWADFHRAKSVFLEFRGLKTMAKASKLSVQCLRNDADGVTTYSEEDEHRTEGLASQLAGRKRKYDSLNFRRQERDARQEAIVKT